MNKDDKLDVPPVNFWPFSRPSVTATEHAYGNDEDSNSVRKLLSESEEFIKDKQVNYTQESNKDGSVDDVFNEETSSNSWWDCWKAIPSYKDNKDNLQKMLVKFGLFDASPTKENKLQKALNTYVDEVNVQEQEVEEIQTLLRMVNDEIRVSMYEIKQSIKKIAEFIDLESISSSQRNNPIQEQSSMELFKDIKDLLSNYPSLPRDEELDISIVESTRQDRFKNHQLVKQLVALYIENKYGSIVKIKQLHDQVIESAQNKKLNM